MSGTVTPRTWSDGSSTYHIPLENHLHISESPLACPCKLSKECSRFGIRLVRFSEIELILGGLPLYFQFLLRLIISVAMAWLENQKLMSWAILGLDRTTHVTVTSADSRSHQGLTYYGFKSRCYNLNPNRKPMGSYFRINIIEYKYIVMYWKKYKKKRKMMGIWRVVDKSWWPKQRGAKNLKLNHGGSVLGLPC